MAEAGKLSASKIMTWMICPFAYYLKYLEHDDAPESVALVFGKSIHRMLAKFYKENFKSDESFSNYWRGYWNGVVAGDFLEGKKKRNLKVTKHPLRLKNGSEIEIRTGNHVRFFNEDVIKTYFAYRGLGMEILKRFFNRQKGRQKPLEIEKHFDFIFDDFILTGIWDRIDERGGKKYIIDYKTDKQKPSPVFLDNNPQFTIYSAAFRATNTEKEEKILLVNLRNDITLETERHRKDFEYLKRLCGDLSEDLAKERFTPHYGFQCNFCDHAGTCANYNSGKKNETSPPGPNMFEAENWQWGVFEEER